MKNKFFSFFTFPDSPLDDSTCKTGVQFGPTSRGLWGWDMSVCIKPHSHRGYDSFYHFNLFHAARHCLARLWFFFFFRKWIPNSREICCNWFCIQLICRYSNWLIHSYFHAWFLPKFPFGPSFLFCTLVWCMCAVCVPVHTNWGSQDLECSVHHSLSCLILLRQSLSLTKTKLRLIAGNFLKSPCVLSAPSTHLPIVLQLQTCALHALILHSFQKFFY